MQDIDISAETISSIRKVLWQIWDPLRVSGSSSLIDEYDDTLEKLFSLERPWDRETLIAFLCAEDVDLGAEEADSTRAANAADSILRICRQNSSE